LEHHDDSPFGQFVHPEGSMQEIRHGKKPAMN
jgi:hypothetical protein